MEAIETLMREHRVMEAVCRACVAEVDASAGAGTMDVEGMERFIEFFRFYTHSCHDPKEEDLLFTMLHRTGLAWEDEPLAGLIREHEEMRVVLNDAVEWAHRAKRGDAASIELLRRDLGTYAERVTEHMKKEDEGVFLYAQRTLTPADLRELTEAFENVACDEGDEGVLEYYQELARELSSQRR